MAHPREEITDPGWIQNPTYKQIDPSGLYGGMKTYTGGSHRGGAISYRLRAPSTFNPKDPSGWRPPSVYYGKRLNTFNPWFTAKWVTPYRGLTYEVYDTVPEIAPSSTFPDLAADLNKMRTKAYKKFGDVKVDFSVAFAERQKTIDLVADTARRFANAFQRNSRRSGAAMKGKTLRPGSGSRRKAEDVWLEMRYGWAPTLMDLEGAIEWLDSRDDGGYKRYRIRAKASVKRRTYDPGVWTDNYHGAYFTIPMRYRDSYLERTEVKGTYFATLNDNTFRSLNQCGVINPLTTVWELVPYSFVVDWFVGVGDYLSSLSAFSGLSFLAGSETMYCSRVSERTYSKRLVPDAPGFAVLGIEGQACRSTYSEFSRSAIFTPPGLSLVIKEHPFTTLHMIDAISLLAGLVPGAGKLVTPRQWHAAGRGFG